MAETLLNCFAASEGLFLDVVEKYKAWKRKCFLKRLNKSRKRFLEEALGLCVVANKRERKKRSGDERGILRGGETAN